MVELCELKLVDQNLESQWPADIDQHIAQLDFQRSTDEEDISLFSSMALDPSIISTDSLDIEKLHARCEEYKEMNYWDLFIDFTDVLPSNLIWWSITYILLLIVTLNLMERRCTVKKENATFSR
ncbi:unnamed protein product [Wuchereria bancrofti]|uniref:Uncharacterized protein n=1 Tax=Wuchereria bancrofti TaxID=6293 RepID=A0A3P7FK54_WUCBA|nr:unnamed protein product [Wuchereria bancrofti]